MANHAGGAMAPGGVLPVRRSKPPLQLGGADRTTNPALRAVDFRADEVDSGRARRRRNRVCVEHVKEIEKRYMVAAMRHFKLDGTPPWVSTRFRIRKGTGT